MTSPALRLARPPRLARPARLARHSHLALLAAALVLLPACAAPTSRLASLGEVPDASQRRRDVIGAAEINAMPRLSAFDAIRTLRPEYTRTELTIRGGAAPVVYVDGARWGSLDALSSIPSHLVADVRRLRPVEARLRYGQDVWGSVIEVRLLRPTRR